MNGIVQINNDDGEILSNNTIIHINKSIIKKHKLLHNDIVLYTNNDNINIISRVNKIVGVLIFNEKIVSVCKNKILKRFIPIDNKYPEFMIKINPKHKNNKNNVYCSIKPMKFYEKYIQGCIINIFGNVGDYYIEKLFLKHKYIPIKKLEYTPQIVDLTPNRINLTSLITFSIDPINCEDIDDAFSIMQENDITKLYIHIADPSSYIEENSEFDKILSNRCTSIYLSNERIDMMPTNFTINECSLKKNKISRSFTTMFTLDINYNIVDYVSYKSLIVNKYCLSYDEAQNIVTNINSKNNEIYSPLLTLYNICKNINNCDIYYDCHKMVEICMILINEHVAKIINKYNPDKCILRVCKQLKIVDNKHVSKKYIDICNMILSDGAKYQCGNSDSNHDQLNLSYYTHFSSPIRRYIDIIIHRMYYNAINNITISNNIDIINNINKLNKLIKKIQHEDKILDLIYCIHNEYNSVLNTDGVIVNINDNILTIYIDNFDIIVKKKIIPNKYKKSVNYISCSREIIIGNTIIKLFDIININLVTLINAIYFKNKLLVDIVNPIIEL
jgi:exoribonuclease R